MLLPWYIYKMKQNSRIYVPNSRPNIWTEWVIVIGRNSKGLKKITNICKAFFQKIYTLATCSLRNEKYILYKYNISILFRTDLQIDDPRKIWVKKRSTGDMIEIQLDREKPER